MFVAVTQTVTVAVGADNDLISAAFCCIFYESFATFASHCSSQIHFRTAFSANCLPLSVIYTIMSHCVAYFAYAVVAVKNCDSRRESA